MGACERLDPPLKSHSGNSGMARYKLESALPMDSDGQRKPTQMILRPAPKIALWSRSSASTAVR
jgi:hypothetical protein